MPPNYYSFFITGPPASWGYFDDLAERKAATRRHMDGLNLLWLDGHVDWQDTDYMLSEYKHWYPSWW